ncbi:hypothetical protein FKW77_000737 [Venturia effusa]|uniref:HRDC domain-containing protein n=1 Tax=Venturia effusa TaxID=50376 RepID=A0A517LM22_9PEZI|nr:hypothetical protein FKW77_000737 [Venturia effusa]
MANAQPFSWTDALIAEDEVSAPIRITDRLSHHIPGHKLRELQARPQASIYWSYEWYRNSAGKTVTLSYASTREQSEELAKRFLKEKVLGFDMEWKADFTKKRQNGGRKRKHPRTLKDEISLIQIASTDEIALFHIALHKGTRPVELVARSLREIIESDAIIKTGVGIYSADASRLRRFMKFQPRGMLDLNHLHRLVDISSGKKMIGLSEHARLYLGFPLFKGKVRTSDWTKPLTIDQQNYAASDAYVGLVLYHVLDVRRLNMDPIPPHPELDRNPNSNSKEPAGDAEPQVAKPLPRPQVPGQETKARIDSRANLVCATKAVNVSPVLSPRRSIGSEPVLHVPELATPAPTLLRASPLEIEERRLLATLHSLRFRLQRSTGVPLESIAGDDTLIQIGKHRPTSVPALCRIPGAGKLYQICKGQQINLLDCISSPPTSISFDSNLSLVKTVSATNLQSQSMFATHIEDAQSGASSRRGPAYTKKRRRSCSSTRGQDIVLTTSLQDATVDGAKACGTARDPISISSSPVFFETLDTVRDVIRERVHNRNALAEILVHDNTRKEPSQSCRSPSLEKRGPRPEDVQAACSVQNRSNIRPVLDDAGIGTPSSTESSCERQDQELSSALHKPSLRRREIVSQINVKAQHSATSPSKETAPFSGMETNLPRASSGHIRINTSFGQGARKSANAKTSVNTRRCRKKEETQVILDTQLAIASLDFQLSSDPPSPHHEQYAHINMSAQSQRTIVSASPVLRSSKDSVYTRTRPVPKGSREVTQTAPSSSSDYEVSTSLFAAILGEEAKQETRLSGQAKRRPKDDSGSIHQSASAWTDYDANESLFSAAVGAEQEHGTTFESPSGTRVHRSSSVDEMYDANSSFTVA